MIIVGPYTGRLQPGRRWSEGLHQAIEAKEGVNIQKESKTYASITYQNYFRLYSKLAGMTGTALTSAEEFYKVYGLNTVAIPTNRPVQRIDRDDLIYQTENGKLLAIAKKVKEKQKLQSDYIMGHSPEYQTQEGTISPANEQDMSSVTQLLTLKAGQYAKLGALDSDNPDDYNPETVVKIRESKTAGYTLSKNYDGSGTLIVTDGNIVQKVPLTAKKLGIVS